MTTAVATTIRPSTTYDFSIRDPFINVLHLTFKTAQITNGTIIWEANATIRHYTAKLTVTNVQSAIIWYCEGVRPGTETETADASCQLSGSVKTWCSTTQVEISSRPLEDSSFTITKTGTKTSFDYAIATLTPSWIFDGTFYPILSSTKTRTPSLYLLTHTLEPDGRIISSLVIMC